MVVDVQVSDTEFLWSFFFQKKMTIRILYRILCSLYKTTCSLREMVEVYNLTTPSPRYF